MIAYTTDLTPHGNYFAEGAYLEQDLAAGLLRNRAGTRMLALSDDFLLATLNTLQEKLGNDAERVIKSMGRDWGQRAAQQFAVEMELFLAQPEYARSIQIGQYQVNSSMSIEEIANLITRKSDS